jgi:SAM-dependent methyltransferase
MAENAQELSRIYQRRFSQTHAYRVKVWQLLTREFFQQWIDPKGAVLDLGCGYGEFINHIQAGTKWAMDLNPDAPSHLSKDIRFVEQDCSAPWAVPAGSLDTVFTSNFFEHLPDKQCLRRTLHQVRAGLKPGGRLIAMGPNIKYLPGLYWDFFDHHTILTEASLAEVLETEGFILERVEAKFLPYTLVNAPEYPLFFLSAYLALPLAWRIFGRQFLVVARKPGPTD